MAKWTRRDLVKVGLAAGVGAMASGEMRAAEGAPAPGNAYEPEPAAAEADGLRERLLLDFDWKFALGDANDPEKDFGYGKLRRDGTYAKAGRIDGPAAVVFQTRPSAWTRGEGR